MESIIYGFKTCIDTDINFMLNIFAIKVKQPAQIEME